jgi:hypothetical protein
MQCWHIGILAPMISIMSLNDITPRQLRALLLLLVLVPLIPTAMMVRFMMDALKAEKLSAFDRIQQLQTQNLSNVLREHRNETGSDSAKAEALLRAFAKPDFKDITTTIYSASGNVLAGEPKPYGQRLAQAAAPGISGATLHIYLAGPHVLDEAISEQRTN